MNGFVEYPYDPDDLDVPPPEGPPFWGILSICVSVTVLCVIYFW